MLPALKPAANEQGSSGESSSSDEEQPMDVDDADNGANINNDVSSGKYTSHPEASL